MRKASAFRLSPRGDCSNNQGAKPSSLILPKLRKELATPSSGHGKKSELRCHQAALSLQHLRPLASRAFHQESSSCHLTDHRDAAR
eukprot:6067561-Amphidinium_carterae.1